MARYYDEFVVARDSGQQREAIRAAWQAAQDFFGLGAYEQAAIRYPLRDWLAVLVDRDSILELPKKFERPSVQPGFERYRGYALEVAKDAELMAELMERAYAVLRATPDIKDGDLWDRPRGFA